ncbi:(2Fe-2S)-binding protein [Zhengella mangrovi]|uniref:(2Fe-2S)-binding protein n=1 Tax=Zhengella mangrovi TaxID=1982044 RepID=A0A2G1QK94_9HYPH|nr:2Fe-2S iron-sulfur cluster-binding protein [Zhengella mangrovi]PHP65955.1 (2Fe-2S)-binding protein [Zhengella mangrovi]
MIHVTFVQPDGSRSTVEARAGESAMQAAVSNAIAGIEAECGGSMSCATCHCYVGDGWFEKTGERGETETDMLEFAQHEMRPESRLACQITMSDELDGLTLFVPG